MASHWSTWVLCTLIVLQFLVLRCQAQVSYTFGWQFPSFVSTTLSECQTVSLKTMPLNSTTNYTGTPPFYLISMEVDGVPTTTEIGSDPNALSWQVQHPRGSTLLLTMVDANGDSGGVAQSLYNVTVGDTSCLTDSSPPFRITPNVTTDLKTCEPWGLNITGPGTKPYSVTIISVNVPHFTNVTMGPLDDVFTYINYQEPGNQLMAAVVDANGQWGFSTPLVNTVGSQDNVCPGLKSTSQTSAQIQAQEQEALASNPGSSHKSNNHAGVIVGVIFGLGVPLVLLGVYIWWWRRRRNLTEKGIVDGQDARPRTWELLDSSTTESVPSPFMSEAKPVSPLPRKESLRQLQPSPRAAPLVIFPAAPTLSSPAESPIYQGNSTAHSAEWRRPPIRSFSTNSTSPAALRIEKSLTILSGRSYTLPSRPHSPYTRLGSAVTSSRSFPSSRQNSLQSAHSIASSSIDSPQSAHLADGRTPDIIIQHLDAGVVEELPPPYLDRSSISSTAGSSAVASSTR